MDFDDFGVDVKDYLRSILLEANPEISEERLYHLVGKYLEIYPQPQYFLINRD